MDEPGNDCPEGVDGVVEFPAQWGTVVQCCWRGYGVRESVAAEDVLLLVVPEKFVGDLKCTEKHI